MRTAALTLALVLLAGCATAPQPDETRPQRAEPTPCVATAASPAEFWITLILCHIAGE